MMMRDFVVIYLTGLAFALGCLGIFPPQEAKRLTWALAFVWPLLIPIGFMLKLMGKLD